MRFLVLGLCIALSACQSHNPYHAQSLPLPNAPATSAAIVYPAATHNVQSGTWAWYAPPQSVAFVSSTRLEQIIGESLDQRGLRPAAPHTSPEMLISAHLEQFERERRIYDDPYHGYGSFYPYHGRYGYQYGPRVRVYRERIWRLNIEVRDERTNYVTWQGHSEVHATPHDPEAALYRAARRALATFPAY